MPGREQDARGGGQAGPTDVDGLGFERGLMRCGQLLGQRAMRMGYTWHNGSYPFRQLMVLCALDGWLYEITFSDVPQRFDQTVPAFEHWLSSLAVAGEGRGPGQPAKPIAGGLDLNALFRRP